jgi:enolase-phosphatase E1
VTSKLADRGIQTVVLDIEGTTTPVAFVYEVLFPYARRTIPAYVSEHLDSPGLRETTTRLREEWGNDAARGESPPEWRDHGRQERVASVVAYLTWLMDHDRKSPALKTLQGEVWARGYDDGSLRGEVFPDVPDALERWRSAGIDVTIYSSGSVLAQQMLFQTTSYGDLTRHIAAYFDTGVGPKSAPESYRRIAATLGRAPDTLLFISDMPSELRAASATGLAVLLCARNSQSASTDTEFEVIKDFTEVV